MHSGHGFKQQCTSGRGLWLTASHIECHASKFRALATLLGLGECIETLHARPEPRKQHTGRISSIAPLVRAITHRLRHGSQPCLSHTVVRSQERSSARTASAVSMGSQSVRLFETNNISDRRIAIFIPMCRPLRRYATCRQRFVEAHVVAAQLRAVDMSNDRSARAV